MHWHTGLAAHLLLGSSTKILKLTKGLRLHPKVVASTDENLRVCEWLRAPNFKLIRLALPANSMSNRYRQIIHMCQNLAWPNLTCTLGSGCIVQVVVVLLPARIITAGCESANAQIGGEAEPSSGVQKFGDP